MTDKLFSFRSWLRHTGGISFSVGHRRDPITFAEGTHNTFELKVGKDKVTLIPTTTDTDFPGGWDNETDFSIHTNGCCAGSNSFVFAPDVRSALQESSSWDNDNKFPKTKPL